MGIADLHRLRNVMFFHGFSSFHAVRFFLIIPRTDAVRPAQKIRRSFGETADLSSYSYSLPDGVPIRSLLGLLCALGFQSQDGVAAAQIDAALLVDVGHLDHDGVAHGDHILHALHTLGVQL